MDMIALLAASAAATYAPDTVHIPGYIWGIIGVVATLALGVIGFFLKSLVKKPEKHDEAITDIRLSFASKEEVRGHDKDINHIKQTYVSKDELKDFKAEMRGETKKLASDVQEIKDNYLKTSDYLHHQTRMDNKLETMYQLLLELKGGMGGGR